MDFPSFLNLYGGLSALERTVQPLAGPNKKKKRTPPPPQGEPLHVDPEGQQMKTAITIFPKSNYFGARSCIHGAWGTLFVGERGFVLTSHFGRISGLAIQKQMVFLEHGTCNWTFFQKGAKKIAGQIRGNLLRRQFHLEHPHEHTALRTMSGDVRVSTGSLVTNLDAHLRSLGHAGGQEKRDAGLQLLNGRTDAPNAPATKDFASSFISPDKAAALVR